MKNKWGGGGEGKRYHALFDPDYVEPSLTEIIFEAIEKASESPLFQVFFSGYARSYRAVRQGLHYPTKPLPRTARDRDIDNKDFERKMRNRFRAQLAYLQKRGFVEKRAKGILNKWRLTDAGRQKFERLIQGAKFKIKKYEPLKENKSKIVIFDIPEKEKRKRQWLREQLLELDYIMLQKSVWIGKAKLPRELFSDLSTFNLLQHIHIFKVSEEDAGTINVKIAG
ncbi:MAG: hypothetical protein A3J67_00560 [Parcubacteria group bacterium RIFCSPHIGHO2_02_FULL_48_10b]|nr:MAG: hypothetical protein A3J67_00560 [Parcubacteria group bacterium RIFCSPHIGHO2_02_FULL_48_10b]